MKGLMLIVAVLALAYFGLGFAGYRVAPENIHYYLPAKTDSEIKQNQFARYFDNVKFQNKVHPLIVRKRGVSGAEAMDQSSTKVLKDLLQVDKFNQLEKVKTQIKEISAKANERDKALETM